MALEGKTSLARVYEEQAEKLGWLFKIKGIRSADFIGARIETDLDTEFESIRPLVEQIEASRRKPGDDPAFAAEIGGEG